jgi:hypothetical protein
MLRNKGRQSNPLPMRFPAGGRWEAEIQEMPDFVGERGGTRTLDPMIESHGLFTAPRWAGLDLHWVGAGSAQNNLCASMDFYSRTFELRLCDH